MLRITSAAAAPGHLGPQLLVALARFALAIIDELDRFVLPHWAGDVRRKAVADGLIDEVVAIVGTANSPFEADGFHRPRTDLEVAVAIGGRDRRRCVLGNRLFRLARAVDNTRGFLVIENARDRRERMIGRVAQGSILRANRLPANLSHAGAPRLLCGERIRLSFG